MEDELRVGAVLREASNRTGLDDFGGRDFLEPLGILLLSLIHISEPTRPY